MEFFQLPILDRQVSRVGTGTWAIGGWLWGGSDEAESIRTLLHAWDWGINLVDTAPIYGFGRSEEIVGKALRQFGHREKLIVATKVGLEWRGIKVHRNCSRQRIITEIEASLKRLQVDYLDIYQIHWPDPNTPISETAETMQELFQDGKIRAIGVSNFSAEQMEAFRKVAPIHTCQPPLNLFEQEAKTDVLPYTQEKGISTLVYGALCRGLLSGRMENNTRFEGDDLRKFDPKFKQPRYGAYLKAIKALNQLAQRKFNKQVIHLALRWLLDQPGVGTILWGIRHPGQLEPLQEIFDWHLEASTQQEIDQILKKHIPKPLGAEFMAPPLKRLF